MNLKHLRQKVRPGRVLYTQILFVVLAFAAMILLSHTFMSSIVRGGLVRSAGSVLNVTRDRIAAYLQECETALENFSTEVRERAVRGDTPGQIQEYADEISALTSSGGAASFGIRGYYAYLENAGGEAVFIAGGSRPLPQNAHPRETQWYRLAMAAGGDAVQTVPAVGEGGETLFTYAVCLLDDAGGVLGVACMDVNLDMIGQEVVTTALNQGGYGMLMNQDLTVMFHPNADFAGVDIDEPSFPVHIFADELRAGQEISERPLISYKNEKSVAFFRTLPNGWYLGLVTPESQYYASMGNMAFTLIVLGGALAAALAGILIRIDLARAKSDDENKKKSMFLANMSHEIRTPINAIVGMTAIGRAAGTAERKDYCFSKIDNASKHLLGVVNDILDISKIEANKIELSPTHFNFEKMLQQAVNVITFRVDEKKQKLMVHIDKEIPKNLYADDQRFAQTITNLLGNAVKFTPNEGAVTLRATYLGEQDGLCGIQIEVSDTGIGISPQQQAKLFQPFQQAESSTTRKYGGTGLGLAISKSIVEMMGGRIWVESQPGQGTTVAFTVKAQRGEDLHFDVGRRGVNWENIRILAVDDDPDILLYFQEIVSGFGAKCAVAESAGEALSLVEQNGAYDIYFVDLRMPEIDGIRLTKAIREKETHPENSVVIMISSADLSAVESDAKRAGVNKFLLKPLFPSAIADVISECIGASAEKAENLADIGGIFTGRRILFAEDIEINREIFLTLLEPTGLQTDCAENGAEAVRLFSEGPEKYDLILMDIQMPEMDGYEATRKIRALGLPRAASVPIIAMTANVFKEDIENCLAAGMNSHLGKPLNMEAVIRELARHLPAGGAG